MADTERLVEIELLGQGFKFYTASSDEEMRSILKLVRQLVETDNKSAATIPVGKVAVLACLNIASRYVKLEQEFEGYRRDSDERLMRLNDEIRAGLLKE
ncbi:MAG: cell division protein ZapA [Desulfobulbaceae bacterium]|nr:cell division protein ZapA [Desulfobulbaceae bacterium]